MTIDEVLAPFHGEAVPDWEAVKAALLVREDNMAEIIRLAAAQFGMYPWIVTKVLSDVGLGTPSTDEMVKYIDDQFADGMAELRRQWAQQHPNEGEQR